MQRKEMVLAGTKQLVLAENVIETALCEVAVLAERLGRMRLDSNLSAMVGQDTIEKTAKLYTRLSKARRDVLEVHETLNIVKTQIGCGAVLTGAEGGKPGTHPSGRLVAVEAKATAA